MLGGLCVRVCVFAYEDGRTTFRNWFSSSTTCGSRNRIQVLSLWQVPLPTELSHLPVNHFEALILPHLPGRTSLYGPRALSWGFSVFWHGDNLALACSSLEWALSLRHLAFLCWWWKRAFRSSPKSYSPLGPVGLWVGAELSLGLSLSSPSCAGPRFPSPVPPHFALISQLSHCHSHSGALAPGRHRHLESPYHRVQTRVHSRGSGLGILLDVLARRVVCPRYHGQLGLFICLHFF